MIRRPMKSPSQEAPSAPSKPPLLVGQGIAWGTLVLGILAALWGTVAAILKTFDHPGFLEVQFGLDVWGIRLFLICGSLALLASAWPLIRILQKRQSAAAVGTGLRYLFEIAVLGSVAHLVFVQPFRLETLQVSAGLTAALWGLALAATLFLGSRSLPKWLVTVDLIGFNLCLFLVLLEAGLRLAGYVVPSQLLVRNGDRPARLVWTQKMIRQPGEYRFGFPFNSQAYYDTELRPRSERPVVAMIGDSFSYGIVPHAYHLSTVAERELGSVDVYNFGYPGLGPLEYLHLLRHEVLRLNPDVVVVNLFVGNDVTDSRRSQVENPRLRSFWDRRNVLLYLVPMRLGRLFVEEQASEDSTPVAALAGEALDRRIERREELESEYPWLKDPRLEKGSFRPERFYQIEARRARAVCDPDSTSGYAALFSALLEMKRLAGETPLVVQILPDDFQLNNELWRIVKQRSRRRGPLQRNLPQERIGRWLGEQDIPYLDLLPEMRQECSAHHRGIRHCFHLRNTHFNARGNRVAGEAIAEFLRPFLDRR